MAYREAGDLSRAIPLLENTLKHSTKVHGQNHPITGVIRRQLNRATGRT
jgi:hypothetical protein